MNDVQSADRPLELARRALDCRLTLARVHEAIVYGQHVSAHDGPLNHLGYAIGVGLVVLASLTTNPAAFDPIDLDDCPRYPWSGRGRRKLLPARFASEHWVDLARDIEAIRATALDLAELLADDQPRASAWFEQVALHCHEADLHLARLRAGKRKPVPA